ncbi:unnamed protein product [Cercopithifilaria johnstoni]|uniref:Uncharacterized protein n=1 Tax=Cercopithifilaria johnstoni TaxID=2874296 RepID=A0A8J2M3H5_9BILA|nr:unnamed protein product [Cercopithifilaria johnstoni]
MRGRDAEILGLPKHSALDNIPICKSNSKICKFITCSARNFQNDESISNLNLAAQMLADTKLRKAIASDSSILLTVCQEQGLSPLQCKLFANAFQLINRFISTIEPMEEDVKKSHHHLIKDDPYYDDSDAPPIPIQLGVHQTMGSQTWSTNGRKINDAELISQKMQFKEKSGTSIFSHPSRNLLSPSNPSNSNTAATSISLDSMLTQTSSPSTPATLLTFPPLIFTFPTFATVAPMIFHTSPLETLKPMVMQPANLFTKEMQMLMSYFNNKLLLPSMLPPLPLPPTMLSEQFKPINPVESVRNRRSSDYYDNIEEESDEKKSTNIFMNHTMSDNKQKMIKLLKQKEDRKGLLDCMEFLKDN